MFDIHENLENQPEILGELLEEPQLCMLLNPNLHAWQIGLLIQQFYIVDVNYDSTEHLAVVWGFYKQPRETVIKPEVPDEWHALAEEEEEE